MCCARLTEISDSAEGPDQCCASVFPLCLIVWETVEGKTQFSDF
jgi:hypothetical protein